MNTRREVEPAERAAVMQALAAERQRLAAEHASVTSGRPLSRAIAAGVDRAVLALLPADMEPEGWALAATGGYGRGELSPHSDVDLLLLCRRRGPAVERLGNGLFYALWDAKLDVLPATRTVAEARALARDDLATQTASLHARPLAGDGALFIAFHAAVLADARRQGGRPFLRALLAETKRRHDRAAEAAHGLEPDLKNGRGGLRDLHALLWAAKVALDAGGLADVARLGYVDDAEAAAVRAAEDFLLRVRNHLHYLAGRRVDHLFFEYQEDTAAFMGYARNNGHLPVEQLMREMNAHTHAILGAAEGFWERIEDRLASDRAPLLPVVAAVRRVARPERVSGPSVRRGQLQLAEDAAPPRNPDEALALFALAARLHVEVGHALGRRLRTVLAGAPRGEKWSPRARESFFSVLHCGDLAAPLLEAAADCGLLPIYLPEWEDITFLARHDVYHQHTVDRHSLLAVAHLGRMLAGGAGGGELAVTLAAEVADPDTLLLAGLLHDIGKGGHGDHSRTGAAIAAGVAERMGLAPDAAETLAFLVRQHLLLARVGTRRDLEDEATVRQVAEITGEPERLRLLYLLTVADGLATGPSAWTEWKASLVRDLFFRVRRALDGPAAEARSAERLAARRRELATALALLPKDQATVAAFLAAMPASYLLAQTTEAIREHWALFAQPAAETPRVIFRRSADDLHDELTLLAADRPGLLWRVCGVLALHGVNILEARVCTAADGRALDVFRLADAFEASIPEAKQASIVRDLSLALEGRLSLAYRLARKLKHYRQASPLPVRPLRVEVDNAASCDYTVVEVHAPDRLGLLYTIARVLSDLQLDINLARVTTRGPEAVDVFYVRDWRGRRLTDEAHAAEVEQALRFALESAEGAG